MDFPRWPVPVVLMQPTTFSTLGILVFNLEKPSVQILITQMLLPRNPGFGFENLWNPGLIKGPLFAIPYTPVLGVSPLVSESATGSAWERWEDRGHGRPHRPIVPEPSAYGAAMLALVVAVVVARRLASLRSVRGR
jgi:hypothetical protein